MNKAELGSLIVKVFSLFYALRALEIALWAAGPLIFAPKTVDGYFYGTFSIQIFGLTVLSLVLWLLSDAIGKALAGTNPEAPFTSAPASIILTCVFIGVGLVLLAATLPELAQVIVLAAHRQLPDFFNAGDAHTSMKVVRVILSLALSGFLIFGSAGLQRLVLKLRGRDEG